MEKYKKVLRLVEERNWKEMEEWLHEDFMYIQETALMDREEHVKKMEKEFESKQAINQNELLHEDEDMMAFKHVVTQKNGKKFRITQIQLYKEGMVWREISNAIEIDLFLDLLHPSGAHSKNSVDVETGFTFPSSLKSESISYIGSLTIAL